MQLTQLMPRFSYKNLKHQNISVSVQRFKNSIPFCFLESAAEHQSLSSLSEYAPSRLRDDEPFCAALDAFEESAMDVFDSVK